MDKSALAIYDQRNRRHTTDAQLGIPFTEVNNVENVKIDPDFKEENIKYNVELLSKKGTFTGDASAEVGDILQGKSAYVKGEKINGSIPKNGQLVYEASREDQQIPYGYTTGGTVKAVTAAIDPDIVPSKILNGVEILGVVGSVTELHPESITIPPSTEDRTFTPTTGNGFVQVTVNGVTHDIDANIIASNIRENVTILGVTGNIVELNSAEVTINPSTSEQIIRPLSGYNAISRAIVNPVTYEIDSNIVSGNIRKGVTILGVHGLNSVVNTSDANAVANEIQKNKTAYVNGVKVTGSLVSTAGMESVTSNVTSDSNYVYFNSTNSSKKIITDGAYINLKTQLATLATVLGITPEVIKKGVTICGVTGTYEEESLITQEEFDETQATLDDLLTGEYQEAHEILNQVLDTQDEYTGVGGTPTQIESILDEVLGINEPQEDNENNN